MSSFFHETCSQGTSGRKRSRGSDGDDRQEKRKAQNRLAQQRCRQRKLERLQQLEEENDELKTQNYHLQQKLEDVQETSLTTQKHLQELLGVKEERLIQARNENEKLLWANEQLRSRMEKLERMLSQACQSSTNFPSSFSATTTNAQGWVSEPTPPMTAPSQPATMYSSSQPISTTLPLPNMFQQFGDHQMTDVRFFPPSN